jgi:perosamine synthetase
MNNVTAAIGCGQVEMADHHIAERRRIAGRYCRNLRHLEEEGILCLPIEPGGVLSVYWLYSLVLRRGDRELKERIRQRALKEFGIQTRPFYVPMHRLPIYQQDIQLPNAEFLGDHGIVLPTYSGLPDEHIDEISEAMVRCITETK